MGNSILTYADFVSLVTTMSGGISVAVGLAWWISRQFSNTKNLIHEKSNDTQKVLLEKIEYHERHDDQRFAAITNDLWTIKLQNAARYGLRPEIKVDNAPKNIIEP